MNSVVSFVSRFHRCRERGLSGAPASGQGLQAELGVVLVEAAEEVRIGPGGVVHVVHSQADARGDAALPAAGEGRFQVVTLLGQAGHVPHPVRPALDRFLGDTAEERPVAFGEAVPMGLPDLAGIIGALIASADEQHVGAAVGHLIDHGLDAPGHVRVFPFKDGAAVVVVEDAVFRFRPGHNSLSFLCGGPTGIGGGAQR